MKGVKRAQELYVMGIKKKCPQDTRPPSPSNPSPPSPRQKKPRPIIMQQPCRECLDLQRQVKTLQMRIDEFASASRDHDDLEARERLRDERERKVWERRLREQSELERLNMTQRLQRQFNDYERHATATAERERREWILHSERKKRRNENLSSKGWMIVRTSDRQWRIAHHSIVCWQQKVCMCILPPCPKIASALFLSYCRREMLWPYL